MTSTVATNVLERAPVREPLAGTAERVVDPTRLDKPAFLMAAPFSYSTDVANNAWMVELSDEERRPDRRRAFRQWMDLYHFLASESVVYLLPSHRDSTLQDLVFTANLGMVPEHLVDRSTAIVANFSSPPRVGEADLGLAFFQTLGYVTVTPPHHFEGEAELKHLHGNVYAGGYGLRSERAAYEWMERHFDMQVVKLRETDEYLYHLDCTVFPLTRDTTLMCTEAYSREEVQELERHTNVIDVSLDDCYAGICNSVRLSNSILSASHIHELRAGCEDYPSETSKIRRLEDIAANHGFELYVFNLSEYLKAGALLSCMVLHLNRNSYEFTLL